MKITDCNISGLKLIQPDIFSDPRGYFFESYNKKKLIEYNFDIDFVQDNISKSEFGTIRGLHYQIGEFTQGKLCQVIVGKVLDVAVDIRFNSPTFGKHIAVELSDENHLQFWMPPGFAHGFAVLSEYAIFHYKCTQFYNKAFERSILFNDKDLNIDWKIQKPILSQKDIESINFINIEKDFIY